MGSYYLIQRTDIGAFYRGSDQHGPEWTDWRPHAMFGDRRYMIRILQWLRSLGYKVKLI